MNPPTKEEFEQMALAAFKNAALEMKAFCTDQWMHVPRDYVPQHGSS